MDEKKQLYIKSLAEKPDLPSMYWVLSFSIAICFIFWNAISRGYTAVIEGLLIFFFVVSIFLCWFAYKCFQNKQKLYIAYSEEEKRANSQSRLREQCEDQINDLLSENFERLTPLLLEYLSNNNLKRKG